MSYVAKSLEEIADLFATIASGERTRAKHARLKKEKEKHLTYASAWDQASEFLRDTKIDPDRGQK